MMVARMLSARWPVARQMGAIAFRPCTTASCAVTPSTGRGLSELSCSGVSRPLFGPDLTWLRSSRRRIDARPAAWRSTNARSR